MIGRVRFLHKQVLDGVEEQSISGLNPGMCLHVQLAVLSGRVPVWPDFACDSPWLYEEGARERAGKKNDPKHWFGADFRADLEVVPRQPVDSAPSSRRCLVWRYYDIPCNVHVSSFPPLIPHSSLLWQVCCPILHPKTH